MCVCVCVCVCVPALSAHNTACTQPTHPVGASFVLQVVPEIVLEPVLELAALVRLAILLVLEPGQWTTDCTKRTQWRPYCVCAQVLCRLDVHLIKPRENREFPVASNSFEK